MHRHYGGAGSRRLPARWWEGRQSTIQRLRHESDDLTGTGGAGEPGGERLMYGTMRCRGATPVAPLADTQERHDAEMETGDR